MYHRSHAPFIHLALDLFLTPMGLDPGQSILVAGAAAYMHGLREDLNDIDFFHLGLRGMVEGTEGPYALDGGPAVGMSQRCLDYAVIDNLRVQTIPAMLAFYQTLNRPKDQQKIRDLERRLRY